MATVYGGNDGGKLFLQNQIMEPVYRFVGSGHEIVPVETLDLYIHRISVTKHVNSRNAKMHGTLFNYIGYMAHAVYKWLLCSAIYI